MAGSVVRELITLWGFDIDKKPLQELDAGINTIKSSLKAVGIAAAATSAAIGFVLNEAGKQEQTEVAFETLLGSAELAQQKIKELHEFASRTPFSIPGIEQNAKQLIGMGIEVESLLPTMKALGDVSAGLSVPLERIALNYGQIKAQGKLTGRELRDFAVAGVPLLDQLAKQFGKTKEEVQGMVSAGKVGFSDVEKAFVAMTSAGGRFDNLMIKQSKTFKGLVSNAGDFLIMFSRELGKEVLPAAKELVSEVIAWAQANRKLIMGNMKKFLKNLVSFLKGIVNLIKVFAKALNGVVQVFGGWNKVLGATFKIFTAIMGLGILTGIGLITKALWGMVVAWKAMGAAALFANIKMMLIPLAIGAIVTAIALIAEDIVAFTQGRDSVFGRMLDGITMIFGKIAEKFAGLGGVFRGMITFFLTPIRIIINGFKSLLTIIDVIRGKMSFMKGLKTLGSNILSNFGLGGASDSLQGALGFADSVGAATEEVEAGSTPSAAIGSGVLAPKQSNKNVTVENKLDLKLDVTGMEPEAAKSLVTDTLGGELDAILRGAVRDGESQIER
jgi:tape measure domain-containing protein